MKFAVMQVSVMAGKLGDIFWDLAPWLTYAAGYDLGCSIYVANPTSEEQEYALIARLTRDTIVLSEEALPVFGYTWFKVDPDDFIELHGALRFNETNAVLTVQLMERKTGETVDSVATMLVAPTTAALPPAWPEAPGAPGSTGSSMLGMMLPMLTFVMLGMVMVSAFKPGKEKEAGLPTREKGKLLLPGREE